MTRWLQLDKTGKFTKNFGTHFLLLTKPQMFWQNIFWGLTHVVKDIHLITAKHITKFPCHVLGFPHGSYPVKFLHTFSPCYLYAFR